MRSFDPPPSSNRISVFQLANEVDVTPELIWGVAQRLEVGAHLKHQGGFVFTSEEAERVKATVRMLLQHRADEGRT